MTKEKNKGFNYFLHKLKVMFKNIWKLIKKLFNNIYKKIKNNKLAKVIILSIIIIIVIVLLVLILKGSSTSVVKTYSKGLIKEDANKIYSVINSNYIKDIEDSSGINVLDSVKESINNTKRSKIKYESYKIIDSYKLNEYEKTNLINSMKLYARELDSSKIKNAKRYLVKYKINTNGNITYTYTSVYAVKRGFSWSVVYNA